jgi:hypothetical protein
MRNIIRIEEETFYANLPLAIYPLDINNLINQEKYLYFHTIESKFFMQVAFGNAIAFKARAVGPNCYGKTWYVRKLI